MRCGINKHSGVPRGTPYNGQYGEAPSQRGIFYTLQVYERVEISRIEVYERVEISRIEVYKRVEISRVEVYERAGKSGI